MNLDHLDFDIVSNFVLRISYFASLGIFTLVESALQINSFMQNKANFRKSQMNVSTILTKDYENWTLGQRGKKQSQTKPNKANFKKAKMNVTSIITKDYENISNWAICENKPNIKPKQTQTKPISKVGYTFLDYAVAIIAGLCYALCRYDLAFRKAVYLNYETYTI